LQEITEHGAFEEIGDSKENDILANGDGDEGDTGGGFFLD
jgi:hypothetical protein